MEMSPYDFPRDFKLPGCSFKWGDVIDHFDNYWATLPDKLRTTVARLTTLGWFISEDMPIDVLKELANLSDDKIESSLVAYYQSKLAPVQHNLEAVFPDRKVLFESAFEVHRHANYNASIPLLLAQADGICKHCLGEKMFSKGGDGYPRTKVQIEGKSIPIGSLLEAIVLPLMKGSPLMLSEKDLNKKRANDPRYSILNRHEIMHGLDLDYGNEKNSLRAISLLSYLACLRKNKRL